MKYTLITILHIPGMEGTSSACVPFGLSKKEKVTVNPPVGT